MIKIEESLSRRIANAGVLCMIAVVLNHCWPPQVSPDCAAWWLYRLFANGYFILPFFFCVSAFFLVGHLEDPAWYRKALKKRVGSLLLPLALWCAIFFVEKLVVECCCRGVPLREFLMTLWQKPILFKLSILGLSPLAHPWMGPLWFLRTLFALVCLSPLIVWAVRKNWRVTLLLTLVVYLLPLPEKQGTWGYFFFTFCGLRHLFAFALGIAWRLGKISLSCKPPVAVGIALLALLLRFSATLVGNFKLCPPEYSLLLVSFERICHFFLAYGLMQGMTARKWPSLLTQAAFPVYLCHFMILDVFSTFCYYFASSTREWLIRAAVGVFGSFLLAIVMRLIAPKAASFIFGGR